MAEQGGGRAPQDRHSAPALKRKRGLSDDAASSRTVHETEEQAQIERLPFEGGLLSQQAHSQVRYKNNGANHKDHLELIGHGNSAVNWIAPERQTKKPGLQLVAKIALDDESFEAFKKTTQREARGAGGVLANIWVQIHEAPSNEEETPNVVNEQSTAADIANNESSAPVVTEEMPVQGGPRPSSTAPSDPFRFGPPSSFTGTPSQVLQHVAEVGAAVTYAPFAEQWVNKGILPPRKRKYKAGGILGLPVRKENPAIPEPQPSPVSCPHCKLHAREDADTHELRDCGYASPNGDIPGCPVCNTLEHLYDACKKRKVSGEDWRHEEWKFLIKYRSGLPPVRTKTVWPDLAVELRMEPPRGFPITKELAIEVRDRHRHGDKHYDPLTRTLGDVRMNLDRLRTSEVFTGMGNQSVNRPSNGAGTSGSNAMELNNAPASANVPATSTESVQAVQTVDASFVAPAPSSALALSSAPAPSSALAGPVAPAAPVQSEAVTEMADTANADAFHFSTVSLGLYMDKDEF